MSSVVSGITKVFSSIGTGLGTAAATLGSAVKAVGSSLFTAGAAGGSGIASGGGFFSNLLGSNSTLGSMFSGVSNILGLGSGGATSAATTAATTTTTGLGSLLENPLVAGGLQGIGKYYEQKGQIDAVKDLKRMDIAANERAADKITKSYNVPNSALVGGSLEASTPQAVTQATTPKTRPEQKMWVWDRDANQIVRKAVA